MNLAEKLIALRSEHHMSQENLAEKIGVSRQSVSKWETGASTPDLEKLLLISNLFEISLDELVKGIEPATYATNTETLSKKQLSIRQILGLILFSASILLSILCFCFAPLYLLLTIYLASCSLPLILAQKHAVLITGWIAWGLFAGCMTLSNPYVLKFLLLGFLYPSPCDYQLAPLIYGYWILLIILIIFTVRTICHKTKLK